MFFLQCMTCHSSCSVQTIKTGFQVIFYYIYPFHQTSTSHFELITFVALLFLRLSPAREGYSERKPPRSTSRLPRSSPWSSWLCNPLHLSLFNQLGLWNQLRIAPCWPITQTSPCSRKISDILKSDHCFNSCLRSPGWQK